MPTRFNQPACPKHRQPRASSPSPRGVVRASASRGWSGDSSIQSSNRLPIPAATIARKSASPRSSILVSPGYGYSLATQNCEVAASGSTGIGPDSASAIPWLRYQAAVS